MVSEQSPNPLDALQSQLKSALDARLTAFSAEYTSALEEARRAARQEAEQALAPKLDSVRAEWAARLESEVAAARADAERRAVADTMRARVEAQQQAAESTARVREELEQALAAERQRADASIRTERARAEAELETLRDEVRRAKAAGAQSAANAQPARGASADASLAGVEHLVRAMRALDGSESLSATLDMLLQHAAATAGRAAIFLVSGDRIKSWRTVGFPALEAQPFEAAVAGTSLIAQAINSGDTVASGDGRPAPTFAAVPPDRRALAVPLTVGDRVAGLLYADNVGGDTATTWTGIVDAMARHAARVLELVTTTRTMQMMAGRPATGEQRPDDEQSARRYARLLVSEIKLYNEPAVRLGRQHRDLLQRLATEIDRARRTYEERVPPALHARSLYFQQELVQTLADGDAALLGAPSS